MLVPTDHTNLLMISKSFKLYQKYHTKIETMEFSLDVAITGTP